MRLEGRDSKTRSPFQSHSFTTSQEFFTNSERCDFQSKHLLEAGYEVGTHRVCCARHGPVDCGFGALTGAADTSPDPAPTSAKDLPADVEASPAIDPKQLAANVFLRITESRNRTTSSNNLKQIALGLHAYASVTDNALVGDIPGKAGKQLLSCGPPPALPRGNCLYKKFKLDEPWDSKHNLALLDKMPKVFASPRATVKRKGYTVAIRCSPAPAPSANGQDEVQDWQHTRWDEQHHLCRGGEQGGALDQAGPHSYDKAKAIPDFGKAYSGKPRCASWTVRFASRWT